MDMMRPFLILSFLLLLVVAGMTTSRFFSLVSDHATLAAVYTNDTEIIEAAIDGPEIPPPENTVNVGVDPATIDYGNINNQNVQNDEEVIVLDDNEPTPTENNEEEPVVETVEVTPVDNSNSQNNNSEGDTTPISQTVTAEEIITSLIGNQAVVTSNQEPLGSFFGNLFGGGGNGLIPQIRIDANKVRSSLRARNIANLHIPNIKSTFGTSRDVYQGMTRDDFTIFVASAALQDEYLTDITYAGGKLTTEYRALGRLFGVLPIRYTLRVTVTLSSSGLQSVDLRYPWYSFFLSTGIAKTRLEQELWNEIMAQIQDNEGEFDVATRAFTAISDVLKLRVGV